MNIPQAGQVPFTDDDIRAATAWREKAEALGEQYKNELTEAGDDADKNNAVIKLIYDEVGPTPMLIKTTLAASIPIVIEIMKYEKVLEKTASTAPVDPDGFWICPCGSKNSGIFCPECGSKKPE